MHRPCGTYCWNYIRRDKIGMGVTMKFRWLIPGVVLVCGVASAQTQTQGQTQKQTQVPQTQAVPVTSATKSGASPSTSQPTAAPIKGRVVEEIVARVNSDVITTVDLAKAKVSDAEDTKQDCADVKCAPDELQKALEETDKNALRDLIDKALLVQRAKDLEISVETDLIKQLDDIRAENKLATLEDLEKAVTASGQDYEEFKTNMRNKLLIDEVITREVGEKVNEGIDQTQVQKYYDEHKQDFSLPDRVYIREILVSTEGKPESEWPALKNKAEQLRERVLNGETFSDLAEHFSDGSTARQGGELGGFERGKLSKQIEDVVFTLNRNEMTPVLTTPKGYLIIQVEERYEAGIQPLDKVEGEIKNRLAHDQMAPKLRTYLDNLRRDSFVEVRPGYVDTGGAGTSTISEAKGSADEITTVEKGPKKHKKLLLF